MPNPAMNNDNRMQWIRNPEALSGAGEKYVVEYELGSEAYITGLLDYADRKIICAPMGTEVSGDGLWLYNLILHYPTGPRNHNGMGDAMGYYFEDGIPGELLALLSHRQIQVSACWRADVPKHAYEGRRKVGH
jgi:hypothetical protein